MYVCISNPTCVHSRPGARTPPGVFRTERPVLRLRRRRRWSWTGPSSCTPARRACAADTGGSWTRGPCAQLAPVRGAARPPVSPSAGWSPAGASWRARPARAWRFGLAQACWTRCLRLRVRQTTLYPLNLVHFEACAMATGRRGTQAAEVL